MEARAGKREERGTDGGERGREMHPSTEGDRRPCHGHRFYVVSIGVQGRLKRRYIRCLYGSICSGC